MKLQLHTSSPKVGTENLLQTLNCFLSGEVPVQTVRSIGIGVEEETSSAPLPLSFSFMKNSRQL